MTQPLMSRIRERRGSKVGPLSRLPERRSHCRDCGMTHGRMRYVHPVQSSPDGPSLWEFASAVVVLLLLFGAIFIGLPIIAEVMR